MREYRYNGVYDDCPSSMWGQLNVVSIDGYRALAESWRRPVRHNLTVQREALWCVLSLDQDNDAVEHSRDPAALVRPSFATPKTCYELESSLRLIPHLLPLTRSECGRLWRNTDFETVMAGEYHIGSIGELALVERWHDWLWDSPPSRHAQASREAEMLQLACGRLANAVLEVMHADPARTT